jgi:hypothetical protein
VVVLTPIILPCERSIERDDAGRARAFFHTNMTRTSTFEAWPSTVSIAGA